MNTITIDNKLPLHYACEKKNFDVIKLLCELKGSVVEAAGGEVSSPH